ncbi:MAG: aspartate dehydrogenase [Clostridium sp.]|nr:aspartate dehydrogenase [Clostridium sp.]
MKPAIRASICTGEKVGGLLDRKTGKFTELRFLRDEKDVEAFARACGVEKVETIY